MMTLDKLYEKINEQLRGSFIPNEAVEIEFVADDKERLLVRAELIKTELTEEEKKHQSGMYPPTHKAKIIFHL